MNKAEQHIAETVIRMAKQAVRNGLVNGSGGNMSFADSEREGYWVTGTGTWLDNLTLDSFAYVSLDEVAVASSSGGCGCACGGGETKADGLPVADEKAVKEDKEKKAKAKSAAKGSGIKPSSEWKMHHQIYLNRPDVMSVVHLHPQMAVVLDALGHDIRFFCLDDALYVKSIGKAGYFPNGSDELAISVQEALVDNNCAIMRNHGAACVGENFEMAFRRACLLEQAARNTHAALVLGDTTTEFPKGVQLIHA